MEYAIAMGSGGMIYISSLITFGSDIQNQMGGGIHRYTDRTEIA
jgi:hypothetical protein